MKKNEWERYNFFISNFDLNGLFFLSFLRSDILSQFSVEKNNDYQGINLIMF